GHHHVLPGTTSINDLPRGQIHPHVVTHHAAHGIRTVTLQEGPNLRVAILRLFPPMHGHHRGQTQTSIRRGVADDRIKSKQRLPNRVRETHTPVPVRLDEMIPRRVLPAPGVTHKTNVHHVLSSRCGSTWVIQPVAGRCSHHFCSPDLRCLPRVQRQPSTRCNRPIDIQRGALVRHTRRPPLPVPHKRRYVGVVRQRRYRIPCAPFQSVAVEPANAHIVILLSTHRLGTPRQHGVNGVCRSGNRHTPTKRPRGHPRMTLAKSAVPRLVNVYLVAAALSRMGGEQSPRTQHRKGFLHSREELPTGQSIILDYHVPIRVRVVRLPRAFSRFPTLLRVGRRYRIRVVHDLDRSVKR